MCYLCKCPLLHRLIKSDIVNTSKGKQLANKHRNVLKSIRTTSQTFVSKVSVASRSSPAFRCRFLRFPSDGIHKSDNKLKN